jgi:signal transduction histidine kinase
MASSRLTQAPVKPLPFWRAPTVLLSAASRSSSVLGHDLIYSLATERFQLFLSGHLAMYFGSGVLLPAWEYLTFWRSQWLLALIAVCAGQCVVLVVALRLARRQQYQTSIILVCVGNWVAVSLITPIAPNLLPVMVLVALVPVVFAEPYIRLRHGFAFALITASCVLVLVALARFVSVTHGMGHVPAWIETAFIISAVPVNALHILVIVWNNAAALRTSEAQLAERAEQLEASRSRVITAADEERRRLERDLHDGAQQHLVALAVHIQLARRAEPAQSQSLLVEASGLIDNAIAEMRRLAHGLYPPLLVSGGLSGALPAIASRAPIPVQVNLIGVERYPAPVEAALYFCCSEAVQNAAKHGGPDTEVTVDCRADASVLTLTVTDTGRGFGSVKSGMGLTNMSDRLSAIGGQLSIDSALGHGTRVHAVVGADAG